MRTSVISVLALIIALGVAGGYILQLVQQVELEEGSAATLNREVTALRSEVSRLKQEISDLSTKLSTRGQTPPPIQVSSSISALYQEAKDSVVSIEVRSTLGGGGGSGFVYDTLGHIVTNFHVVEGAQRVFVTFVDGTRVRAEVVGQDAYSDLAVLRIPVTGLRLRPLPFANSSNLRVGDPVTAIGNPFGLGGSVTTGIVSQVGRTMQAVGGYTIPNVIQIDAAVNPGNSGGPLLDHDGRVIGITTAIASQTGTFSGLGFAVPSNTVSREVPVLISTGKYDHPWLGIEGMELTDEVAQAMKLNRTKGWLIIRVVGGGPADKAGLKGATSSIQIDGRTVGIGGDAVVSVNDFNIRNGEDLTTFLEGFARPGDTVSMRIIRGGVEMVRQLTLGVRPLPQSP